jgi:hypothetical protein
MHERTGVANIIGWLAVSQDEREALDKACPKGSGLVIKVKVTDDVLWDRIKSGELTELSIGGDAVKEEVE